MDTIITGCAEHAHQLNRSDKSRSHEVRKNNIQGDQQIKERAGSNQLVLGDGCNFQITEVMFKELGMFCNQFIHYSKHHPMLGMLQLWVVIHP
jgi:hypothetical protein